MYVVNPRPGTKVQCPDCGAHVIVNGRGRLRWLECGACGATSSWQDTPAPVPPAADPRDGGCQGVQGNEVFLSPYAGEILDLCHPDVILPNGKE